MCYMDIFSAGLESFRGDEVLVPDLPMTAAFSKPKKSLDLAGSDDHGVSPQRVLCTVMWDTSLNHSSHP